MEVLIFLAGCPSEYEKLKPIFSILKGVVDLIKFFVPVLLILFGTLDLAKAVVAGKEEEMKKSQNMFIKRVIYAVSVFLVVTLVQFVMNFINENVELGKDVRNWISCYNESDT